MAKNKAQLGINIPLFQCHGQPGAEYIMIAGKASEGDRMPATKLMAVDQLPDSDPQKAVIKEFIKLYQDAGYDKKFPINTHSGYAWDAIYVVTNAMKKAGADPKNCARPLSRLRATSGSPGSIT